MVGQEESGGVKGGDVDREEDKRRQVALNRVRQGQADLIAVGAHGRVGAGRAILGSVSTDLMRDPPCDLLIARP